MRQAASRGTDAALLLFLNDRGAVTVWSCVCASALLLLMAVLIDYSRIAAFDHKLEAASQTGVRSVLSAYDETLYERYGLFGRGGSDADGLFASSTALVLDSHAHSAGHKRESRLDILDVHLSSSSVQPAGMLANRDIFRRQVEQEMKVKAPVDLTLELIDKFRPLAGYMKDTAAVVEKMHDAGKIFEQRQQMLEDMLAAQKSASSLVKESGAAAWLPLNGKGGTGDASAGFMTVTDVCSGYAQYLQWIAMDAAAVAAALQEANNTSKGDDKEGKTGNGSTLPTIILHTSEIAAYEKSANEAADRLLGVAAEAQQHFRQLDLALSLLEKARSADEQLNRILSSSSDRDDSVYHLPTSTEGGTSQEPDRSHVQSVMDQVSSLPLGSAWFSDVQVTVEHQRESYRSYAQAAADAVVGIKKSLQGRSHAWIPLLDGYKTELTRTLSGYWNNWVEPGDEWNKLEQKIADTDSYKGQRTEEEKKAASLWQQARKMLTIFDSLSASKEDLEVFQKVGQLFQENMSFNSGENSEAELPLSAGQSSTGGARQAVQQSQNVAGGVFGGIGKLLGSGGERMFAGEYAAQHFSSGDPRKLEKLLFDGGGKEDAAGLTSLDQQELGVHFIRYFRASGQFGGGLRGTVLHEARHPHDGGINPKPWSRSSASDSCHGNGVWAQACSRRF